MDGLERGALECFRSTSGGGRVERQVRAGAERCAPDSPVALGYKTGKNKATQHEWEKLDGDDGKAVDKVINWAIAVNSHPK